MPAENGKTELDLGMKVGEGEWRYRDSSRGGDGGGSGALLCVINCLYWSAGTAQRTRQSPDVRQATANQLGGYPVARSG